MKCHLLLINLKTIFVIRFIITISLIQRFFVEYLFSIALLEPRILELTDPCIAYSDLVGDEKEMDNFGEDFFSLSM
jgi:hypothetical protein